MRESGSGSQLRIDEVNEQLDLNLPEGEHYETWRLGAQSAAAHPRCWMCCTMGYGIEGTG